MFGSNYFLQRVIRSAAEGSISNLTILPTNASTITNLGSFDREEVEKLSPGEAVEDGGTDYQKGVFDSTKKLATDGAILIKDGAEFVSEKSHIPVWAFIIIFIAVFSITCLIGVLCIRRHWRRFKRSDKGKEKIKELSEHKAFGRFVPERWLEPGMEMADLKENEEEPETEAVEEEMEAKESVGRINYKMQYDFDTSNLSVSVVACEELTAMDSSGTSDPYVKVSFLGDKKKKFETKVHRGNLNPKFNETFVFKNVPFDELMMKTVGIQVFDYDRFSSHDMIGEIRIPICQIDISQPIEGWKELQPPVDEDSFLGTICVSLRYAPSSLKMTVTILECKNLKQMDFGGAADPFVKLNLYKDGKKFLKKKTSVKENTLNPYFNESFIFEIPEMELKRCHFVITALDYDLIGTCDPIGRVAIGPNQSGEGRAHWMEMVNNPKRPIAKWHTLEDPDDEKFKPPPKPKT